MERGVGGGGLERAVVGVGRKALALAYDRNRKRARTTSSKMD